MKKDKLKQLEADLTAERSRVFDAEMEINRLKEVNQQLEAEVAEWKERAIAQAAVLNLDIADDPNEWLCRLKKKAELWDWWLDHIEEIEISKVDNGWDVDFRGIAYNEKTLEAAIKAAKEGENK